MKSPRIESLREERHRDTQAAVRAQLHHNAREQHRGRGWRSDVAGWRPGVEGPEAGKYSEADEDQGERPRLKVMWEGELRKLREAHRVGARDDVGGDQSDEHHGAAHERVE